MTETTHDAPPPPLPPPVPPPREAPRLVRDPDDQVVAGVCAAFARSTDTDPVLWRVAVAVLAVFGGTGLVLYALGWLLVPRLGESASFAERTLRRPDRRLSVVGVLLVVVAAVVLVAVLDDGPGFGALLVLAAVGYLVLRERREPGHGAPASGPPAFGPVPPPAYGPPAYGPPAYGPPAYGSPTPWEADAPAPRRPRRSPLGALTLSAATLLTGVLLALRLSGVDALTAERILAVALLVVGAGVLAGTWIGRARWLVPVGLLLVLALTATVAARGSGLEDGVGQRTWTATGDGAWNLGAGEAVLDLRRVRADADISARVGLGSLTVLVPPGVRADVLAEVGMGSVSHGAVVTTDDTDLREEFVVGSGDARVELDLEVGMGEIEVRRVAA